MYKINVIILNNHGELLDKGLKFKTLDEVRFVDINKMVDEAEDYAKENNIFEEELKCNCPWCRYKL